MRVLQVIETGGPGGAETVFARLASGLAQRGHGVSCMVADGSWLPGELTRRGLPHRLMPRSGAPVDGALLGAIRAAIRQHQADLVHAHLFEGAVYAGLAARLEGVPCVATLHGQVDVRQRGAKAWAKQLLFRRTVQRVVAVSEALKRDLEGALRVPAANFRVVVNGVPVGAAPGELPSGADSAPRLLAIGNIRRPKDYPTLLDTLALLVARFPALRLDVVGQPDREGLFESLQAQAASLGVSSHVTFHGFVADPSPLLAQAHCLVLTSTQEGFSLATIEAMLAGVPVVATRSGGPEEILEHGRTGLLVPVGEPAAIADAITQLLSADRTLAIALRTAARAHAAERFSEVAMVERYEAIYGELVPAGRTAAHAPAAATTAAG